MKITSMEVLQLMINATIVCPCHGLIFHAVIVWSHCNSSAHLDSFEHATICLQQQITYPITGMFVKEVGLLMNSPYCNGLIIQN
jgi:hypothetical protein